MSRLHHVRILQQIEVSKNDAIKSVQDSVTDMDNLINSANKMLDNMEGVLESFIHDTSTMLSNFTLSIQKDNDEMTRLRNDKEVCYGDLTNGQENIAQAVQNFTVFPEGFQSKCVAAQQNLQDFMRLNSEIGNLASQL
jgi:peptidoglycan hydrolase CwlO-like protein